MDLRRSLRAPAPSLDSATRTVLTRTELGTGTSRIRDRAGRGSWIGPQRVLSGIELVGVASSSGPILTDLRTDAVSVVLAMVHS